MQRVDVYPGVPNRADEEPDGSGHLVGGGGVGDGAGFCFEVWRGRWMLLLGIHVVVGKSSVVVGVQLFFLGSRVVPDSAEIYF